MPDTMSAARSYTFTHAITRAPGPSITRGLREVDAGAPAFLLAEARPGTWQGGLAPPA